MPRVPLVALLVSAAAAAVPAASVAGPLQIASVRSGLELAPRAAFLERVEAIELPRRGLIEQTIRWQRAVRDVVHEVVERCSQLGDRSGVRLPDLTVLTTEPVANTESSGFGWRDDPIRHRPKFHSGTDFRGDRGTPVLAAGGGVVTFAGRQGGYGNVIYVDHGGGVITRYAHLRRIEAKRDAAVEGGQRIGQVGATGRATGPHLHFEVRLAGRPVDPVTAMTVAQIARGVPALGRIAALALSPELQAETSSKLDPPRRRGPRRESRPDRPGRVKRVRPVS